MSLQIRDVMIKNVITVEADITVKEAANIMNKYEIGCLLVVKGEKAVGIVTERDMLTRVLTKSRNPENTKVEDIMSQPLIVATPEMELEEAARLMFKNKIKKLPVISRNKLVGLVTLTDLARFQPDIIKILKSLITEATPIRIKKVLNFYIV